MYKNHFGSVWKSNGISINKAIKEESEKNFKVVDNIISDRHVKNFIKYEDKPKEINLN